MSWWTSEISRQTLAVLPIALVVLVPGGYTVKYLAGWSLYAVSYLVLTWLAYRGRTAAELTAMAASSRRKSWIVRILLTLPPEQISQTAAMLSLVASVYALPKADSLGTSRGVVLTVCIVAVVTGWLVLQTGFAISYLVLYADGGGLEFPGGEEPRAVDFAYFAVAVGTTFGTTDITVTQSRVRRRVLSHSVLAFVYNTMIVAVTLTIVTSYLPDLTASFPGR